MNKNKPYSSGYEMITKFIGIRNSSLLTGSEKAQESIERILLEKIMSQNDQAIGDNIFELKKNTNVLNLVFHFHGLKMV